MLCWGGYKEAVHHYLIWRLDTLMEPPQLTDLCTAQRCQLCADQIGYTGQSASSVQTRLDAQPMCRPDWKSLPRPYTNSPEGHSTRNPAPSSFIPKCKNVKKEPYVPAQESVNRALMSLMLGSLGQGDRQLPVSTLSLSSWT